MNLQVHLQVWHTTLLTPEFVGCTSPGQYATSHLQYLFMPELRNKHWYETATEDTAYSKIPSIQGTKQIVTGFEEV